MKYYVIPVFGLIEPGACLGPYDTEEEQDRVAEKLWRHMDREEDILFSAELDDEGSEELSVLAYPRSAFDEEEKK